jgi:dihydroneopterin aldolase
MSTTTIFLRNCKIDLSVGIHPHEQQHPQPVVINIELQAELPHAFADPRNADISRTVDYEAIRNFICHDLPRQGHIFLLESVADMILTFCLRDQRVREAAVTIAKPQIFAETEAVGITLRRTQ